MGDPKRPRKKYREALPKHPWQRERLLEEQQLMFEYGLRNKKELWKAKALVSYFRRRARELLALPPEEREEKAKPLLKKLYELGLVSENATVDDILNLTVRDILERRLQTVVYRLGLARTIWQARQMIVHRHIIVNGRICQSPGYLVKRNDKVEIHPRSPYRKMFEEAKKVLEETAPEKIEEKLKEQKVAEATAQS